MSNEARLTTSGTLLFAVFFLTIGSVLFGASLFPERVLLLFFFLVVFFVAIVRLVKWDNDDDPIAFVFGFLIGFMLCLVVSVVRGNWAVGDCKLGCLSLNSLIPVSFVFLVVGTLLVLPDVLRRNWEV